MIPSWFEKLDLSDLFQCGDRVLAAVSGGADSVALLLLLNRARQDIGFTLQAAHFEHGIRGQDSLQDAEFVRQLCKQNDIVLHEGAGNVLKSAKTAQVGLEEAARDARYAFLRGVARQIHAGKIALGHHADDQAETVLMHILRGSGLRGLCGMQKRTGELVRPLLEIEKGELTDWLVQIGQPWREDETNALPDNPRNFLRNRVFPEVKQIYPGAVQALGRISRNAALDERFLEELAWQGLKDRCGRFSNGVWLELEIGFAMDEAILRRIVGTLMELQNVEPSERRIHEACVLVGKSKGAMDLGNGVRAERTGSRLYLIWDKGEKIPNTQLADGAVLPGIGRFKVKEAAPVPIADNPFVQVLNARAIEHGVVRTRRAGDRIHPLGASGSQKLSDYMVNNKLDRPLRDYTPLVAVGSTVLWVVGIGIAQEAAVKEGCSARRVEFIPWEYKL